jgi:hypothetical protein
LGEKKAQIALNFSSLLQTGVGHASSSADILSALQASTRVLGKRISPTTLCAFAAQIEPTNPTIISGMCLFDPDRGMILGKGEQPPFDIRPIACGVSIDTIRARNLRPRWTKNDRRDFTGILELIRHGVGIGSPQVIADAATQSALLHAKRHARQDILAAWQEAQKNWSNGYRGLAQRLQYCCLVSTIKGSTTICIKHPFFVSLEPAAMSARVGFLQDYVDYSTNLESQSYRTKRKICPTMLE